MSITKGRTPIRSLAQWEQMAGPKRADQWATDRSAKEAARVWLEGGGVHLPAEVASAFAAHAAFGEILHWAGEPEVRLRFDQFPGEPRNSDLVVDARDAHGAFLIAIEAKADESFGETVSEALAAALDAQLKNPRSNGIARISQLAESLLGSRQPQSPGMKKIRYQLLTACAGALCEAERRGHTRAVMLVHELLTDKTSDKYHARNGTDLDLYVQRLSRGTVVSVEAGRIHGPFAIPGKPLLSGTVQLFIGKVRRNLRTVPPSTGGNR